ncbi:MAG: NUDIX domain-containing protein, partial [Pseudomonadota bacterium]|nr:NUDIX domain-containing protein [Pseudomonadota bacterium]
MSKQPLKAEDLPYRPCVGVMILNEKGLVWAGRRIAEGNSEYDGSPQLWQMPQGGIDKGEDPLAAAYRELYEETGMRTVKL